VSTSIYISHETDSSGKAALQVARSLLEFIGAIDFFHGAEVLAAGQSQDMLSPISPSRKFQWTLKGDS
jgi:hypothetical protein